MSVSTTEQEDGHEYKGGVLLLTMIEAARVLSIGRTTMYELVAAGEIDVMHIGRSARVPVAALDEYVERRRRQRATVRSTRKWPEPRTNSTRASQPPDRSRRPTP